MKRVLLFLACTLRSAVVRSAHLVLGLCPRTHCRCGSAASAQAAYLRRSACACLAVLCFACTWQLAAAQDAEISPRTVEGSDQRQQLILVVGAPGTDEYQQAFATWASRWKEAAARAEVPCRVIGLADQSDVSEVAGPQASETDLQRLRNAIKAVGHIPSTEPLWIVFIGHGTFDGRTASWNLQGPDVSAEQLADTCSSVQRPLAIIACASCTAPFINALSGPDRVIVTATKDGNQIQYSRFGDAMSLAISTLEADINRDGQTSLLEAWLFATRRTSEFYKTEGRLATEHALLDDNGDAQGVRGELFQGDRLADNVQEAEQIDGKLAARWHFVRSGEERRLTPEQRKTRDAIEDQILELRQKKGELDEADYLQQLEALLLPLSKLYESSEEQQ